MYNLLRGHYIVKAGYSECSGDGDAKYRLHTGYFHINPNDEYVTKQTFGLWARVTIFVIIQAFLYGLLIAFPAPVHFTAILVTFSVLMICVFALLLVTYDQRVYIFFGHGEGACSLYHRFTSRNLKLKEAFETCHAVR